MKSTIFLSLMLVLSTTINAQTNPKKEKIKSLKIAFITNALDLSADEASTFWPIYNKYDEQQFKLRSEKSKYFKSKTERSELAKISDKEARGILTAMEDKDDQLHQVRKNLNRDLLKVVSPVKVVLLKKAEEDFNRSLLKQYRGKKK